jgi:hypothetical protein
LCPDLENSCRDDQRSKKEPNRLDSDRDRGLQSRKNPENPGVSWTQAAERDAWRARADAELDALDGKVRRLLAARDARVAALGDDLADARRREARLAALLAELGEGLDPRVS